MDSTGNPICFYSELLVTITHLPKMVFSEYDYEYEHSRFTGTSSSRLFRG